MLAGRFVLENKNGEVVRTFSIAGDELYLVYRHDTRRVEVVANTKDLEKKGVSYDLLKRTSTNTVIQQSIVLENGAKFRFAKEIDKTVASVNLPEDSEEQEKIIYKYTALAQIGTMLAILVAGLLIEPLFTDKPEETIITVIPQTIIPKREKLTVAPSMKKVTPVKKVATKRVEAPTKPVIKRLPPTVSTNRKENAPLRTKVQVEYVGALGVLGGMKNGSKNSSGFNAKALNDSRGSSWSGAGTGGSGGMERAIPGKGLVASVAGSGGPVQGGGGYGTRGKAGGGRPGYGSMNMGGTAAAYFEPVQEEALVEGGLDKDQIAAVINRHIGEVIYCYEKGLQVQPGLSGRLAVRFVIGGNGIVSTAGIASNSLNDGQVENCIVNRLRGWKFPKPVGGVNVKVTYPFVLKRVSQG